jgi:lipoprotein-releasing system permease protein
MVYHPSMRRESARPSPRSHERDLAVYKYLLCWRYLLTRYLALACIISVMLGVATLIVVNSVMSGFSTKLKDRLHGILADVLVEARSMDGMGGVAAKMEKIRNSRIGDRIESMAPVLEVFAMIQFKVHGDNPFEEETVTRTVKVNGIDSEAQARVDGFFSYLKSQKDAKLVAEGKKKDEPLQRKDSDPKKCFDLSEEGQKRQKWLHPPMAMFPQAQRTRVPGELPEPDAPPSVDMKTEGIIIGHAIAHFRYKDPDDSTKTKEASMIPHGGDVVLFTVGGQKLTPVYRRYALADYFQAEMSEYDSNYVYVSLESLQKLRTMEDRVTSIQIKLKDYDRDAKPVLDELREMFPDQSFSVVTWEEKQGALLSAIDIERGLLNVLLFLIIAVAGFGILSIFAMIVVEKTRDIGILKALGASNIGVMKIFLGYGLLLGIVGAALGTLMGLGITIWLNEIEQFITNQTGHQVFNRSVYYFDKIPVNIQPMTVLMVNLGAIGIATLFSVLPALRAAMLHPVRALRYE